MYYVCNDEPDSFRGFMEALGRLKTADAERVGRACQEQARRPAGG